jgi:hypothetical protein
MSSTWKCPAAVLGLLLLPAVAAAAERAIPPGLPRYDLDVQLDVDQHVARVHQRVTWTNRHPQPTQELVFNVHSHYTIPDDDVGLLAKTLELLRVTPSESLDFGGPACEVQKVTLDQAELPFHYRDDNATALVVPLPQPVAQGETVTVALDFTVRLPPKKGRWGQWNGVTFLCQWLPVLAYYDTHGWQPTPFIPWHQPFFNEAGVYNVQVTLPGDQHLAATGTVVSSKDLGNGLKLVHLFAPAARDFALVCCARYQETVAQVGAVRVRCLAFPEHDHYAAEMVRAACEALPVYERWFGPYPYPEFTIVESYFGWLGNECAGLVMIDERVFAAPHIAGGYVEYLISHELCHQWWYNVIGTNGYCETWLDEGLATYFAHRLLNCKHGRNNPLLRFPSGLEWLPNIHRENYRNYGFYGVLGRGEAGPTVREMPAFKHLVNLLSLTYDKGSKVVGMIEERLGEAAFFDFMRLLYTRYYFGVLRVADFQRELEAYTGQSWEEFFCHWLYGAGVTDWCLESVHVAEGEETGPGGGFLRALKGRRSPARTSYRVTVVLRQKADYNEPTVLGFCVDGGEGYQVRIPIHPQAGLVEIDDPPARVETLSENCVRVEVVLPCRPTQVTVDPDQVLLDRDPANNSWKRQIRWRLTPLYTQLEETDLTSAYDRWNVLAGPWVFTSPYVDPWYTRSTMAGVRAGLYRTQHFSGGAYVAYRTNFRDIVAGLDGLIDHWPWPRTQIGYNLERRLATVSVGEPNPNRGVVFARYVIDYSSSLYLPPFQYVEVFGSYQDNFLPFPRMTTPGAERFDRKRTAGVHYHINYLTPYWDPEGGFQFDVTYDGGSAVLRTHETLHEVTGQLSFVKGLPHWLGPLSETRLAARLYGAAALPDKGEYFPLGGSDLFRGFDWRERQGSVLWVSSLEWRVPLARGLAWDCLDHLAGLRNLYAAAFYDVGEARLNGRSLGGVAHAVGGGLRFDVAWFSFIERTVLRFDVAKTVNVSSPWQFWVGIQHPF